MGIVRHGCTYTHVGNILINIKIINKVFVNKLKMCCQIVTYGKNIYIICKYVYEEVPIHLSIVEELLNVSVGSHASSATFIHQSPIVVCAIFPAFICIIYIYIYFNWTFETTKSELFRAWLKTQNKQQISALCPQNYIMCCITTQFEFGIEYYYF